MSDFVTSAVPPLIPGDLKVRNITVNNNASNVSLLSLPTYTTATLPVATTVAVGTMVYDTTANVLKYVNNSGAWVVVASV